MLQYEITDELLADFLVKIYHKYNYDFIHYNFKSLKRRIMTHCITLNIKEFSHYSSIVLQSKEKFDEMFRYFSINVTEFFREPEQLKIFREKIIPYLSSFSHLKIWCAGCSSGESPYSMAIILHEAGLLEKTQIYATDFNNRVLAHAKDGLFEINNFEQSYINYEKSGGTKTFKEYFIKKGKFYQVKKMLKEKILFFNHNLVTDGIMNEFQLIVCKNVIIYFDQILKEKVINLFYNSLEYNGFLILGKSEFMPLAFDTKFKLYNPKTKVYHKICQ